MGKSRDVGAYLYAIAISSSFITLPLLTSAACAFFSEPKKLPWLYLVLSLVAATTGMLEGLGFFPLLLYPFSIVVSWIVGLRSLLQCKSLLALPMFILVCAFVVSAVIFYAESSEEQAEAMARAFCVKTITGSKFEDVLVRAKDDEKNKRRVRWVQVIDSVKGGEGRIDIVYRGTNLLTTHKCEVTVTARFVKMAKYSYS